MSDLGPDPGAPTTELASVDTTRSDTMYGIALLEHEPLSADASRWRLRVPASLPFFEGHFDGEPILPAVAALAAMVLPAIAERWPESGALVATRGLRFEERVLPDDELELSIERRGGGSFRFVLSRGKVRCATGTLELGPLAPAASSTSEVTTAARRNAP